MQFVPDPGTNADSNGVDGHTSEGKLEEIDLPVAMKLWKNAHSR
jgi:hypothetical protein